MENPDSPMSDSALAANLAQVAGDLLKVLRSESQAGGLDGRQAGKKGDASSNELIIAELSQVRPEDAILSEESADTTARLDARRVWIVDPLDGTREYGLYDRDDWAVHIALWDSQAAARSEGSGIIAAAVALPALGTVFSTEEPSVLPQSTPSNSGEPIRVLTSDSRPPAWIPALSEILPIEARPMGSAGAKAMAVLRGEADAYLHSGGQYEWDSAAPVGVVLAAGFHASRLDGSPLEYNQPNPYLPDLVICRPEIAGSILEALAKIGAS